MVFFLRISYPFWTAGQKIGLCHSTIDHLLFNPLKRFPHWQSSLSCYLQQVGNIVVKFQCILVVKIIFFGENLIYFQEMLFRPLSLSGYYYLSSHRCLRWCQELAFNVVIYHPKNYSIIVFKTRTSASSSIIILCQIQSVSKRFNPFSNSAIFLFTFLIFQSVHLASLCKHCTNKDKNYYTHFG